MKPINLKLTNIGPFCGEHNLDFTELGEMYLICGKMGSGKTTIFDAITYALYGKLPGSRNLIGAKALFSDFASPLMNSADSTHRKSKTESLKA